MFTAAAVGLMGLLFLCVVGTLSGGVETRVAAVQSVALLTVAVIIVLSRSVLDGSFIHVALVVAVSSAVGGLLFARFLEHWL